MIHPDAKFLRAVGMMVGGIVGVGVFGLPYAFAQSGLLIGLIELCVIGFVLVVLQFMYGELAVQTDGSHRLVGYLERYLGRSWRWVGTIAICASVWGAMLAYMIIGGKFLFLLLSPVLGGTPAVYSYVIVFVAALLIYRGLQFASKMEVFVILALLFLFAFMIFLAIPYARFSNLVFVDSTNWFLPYGIILFSLSSTGIVPEMRDVLGGRARIYLGKAILIGMTTIIVLYALFGTAVVSVTGPVTTQVAFDGLVPIFGGSFRFIASILGTLTILSIFLMLGISLQSTFKFDLHMHRIPAWFLTIVVPVLLFSFGVKQFIDLIGFVGSVFGGLLGILIALCYMRLKSSSVCIQHHCLNIPNTLSWLVVLFFCGGLIFTLSQFFV